MKKFLGPVLIVALMALISPWFLPVMVLFAAPTLYFEAERARRREAVLLVNAVTIGAMGLVFMHVAGFISPDIGWGDSVYVSVAGLGQVAAGRAFLAWMNP